jgi:RNA polymerase sigma factor (sigma-70 family)
MRTIEEANRIVEENLGLASHAVSRHFYWMAVRYGVERGDVLAVAHHGLIVASRKWDSDQIPFAAFASFVIRRHVLQWSARQTSATRGSVRPQKLPQSVRRGEEVLAGPGRRPDEIVESKELAGVACAAAMSRLDDRERYILYARVVDRALLRDLSDRFGLSIEGIRLIERRAKEKCRAALATCTQTTRTQATCTQAA